jgi:hypothetical protein
MGGGGGKRPKKSAEEMALERRQAQELDEELEDQQDMLRAVARGRMGVQSLLSPNTSRGSKPTRAQQRAAKIAAAREQAGTPADGAGYYDRAAVVEGGIAGYAPGQERPVPPDPYGDMSERRAARGGSSSIRRRPR